ncbi:MAG TPA: ABC transporter ATP-binding protein [Alphaproteobacteria bacterium]|nr:ABC transporter ATP-binding protein [Alphaproteobacteria bacterium]
MTTAGKEVRLQSVSRSFGETLALQPTDLQIAPGEFLTLLGPSGSGKTTVLNLVAGYLAPSSGRIIVDGADVTDRPPRLRNMGMVFQNYALFPHLSVLENVAFGLRVRRRPKAEVQRSVSHALALVQLEGMGNRMVATLSGGQQQRVALARALVIQPDVLLMDEPLGALDRQLRKQVQLEIRRLHLAHRRSTLYVTHDQEEALVMSDRIAILRSGKIEQIGTADELYRTPANAFVASFLGESNLLRGRIASLSRGCAELEVPGLPARLAGTAASDLAVGRPAVALIRPEDVRVNAEVGLPASIVERVYLGELVALRLHLGEGVELWCRRLSRSEPLASERVQVSWSPDHVRILHP